MRQLTGVVALAGLMAVGSASEPPDAGKGRLDARQPLIVSYYWPTVGQRGDLRIASMATPNAVDVLASEAHGSKDVRTHWTSQGKLLLHRVHPFKSGDSFEHVFQHFAENMQGAAGISIDEVVAHDLTPQRRDTLAKVLRRLREDFPDKLIVAWDASRWNASGAALLRAMRDYCDLLILEVYIPQRDAEATFRAFAKRRDTVEKLAPGVRKKLIFGIGAHRKMRNTAGSRFAEHLAAQVRHVKALLTPSDFQGLAIYAPVYLDEGEQRLLDEAVRHAFFAEGTKPASPP
jgi:hypothetical protein